MTKRTRREFTDEFKNQIVQLYLNGKSKSSILKEYNLAHAVRINNGEPKHDISLNLI